jgi:hypothetical protein
MRRAALASILLSALALGPSALAVSGDISLVSTSDTGVKGNDSSFQPVLSADGKTVAFWSFATNLDSADTDTLFDIYVKSVLDGELTLASTSDSGVKGDNSSLQPALSADGTDVAFYSFATNLDPADPDGFGDVYVKDIVSGDITLASTSDSEVKGNDSSFQPALSADGSRAVFGSSATNLDPGDADAIQDIFVKNLLTGDITLASTSDNGVKGNGISWEGTLSADGTLVAFSSGADNLDPADPDGSQDVYVKDLVTGETTLVSTSDSGVKGNGDSYGAALSADGTMVAFHSFATNLDPTDDTDSFQDIYVKNLVTGDISLASTSDTGIKANSDSGLPFLSADGSIVAFFSTATNLDPADTDSLADIFVKNLITGDITLASASDSGVKGNGDSLEPTLAADGSRVVFPSSATNLDSADTDPLSDIYVKDLGGTPPTSVTWLLNGSKNLPCADGAHWVLGPAKGITSATLFVNGAAYTMLQNGRGSFAADSVGAVTASSVVSATYEGANTTPFLKLSHCEQGETPPPPA